MHSTRTRARAASAVVAVGFAIAACSSSSLRGPVRNTDPPDFGPPNTPICSDISTATAAKNIDSAGGEIVFTNRDHVLTVLRKGVSSQVQFTMVQHQRNFVLVRIAPDAHRFDRPAVLTLSYEGCVLQNGNPLRIYRFNPGEGVWNPLPSFHNPSDMTVSAAIGTLSDYAMGSN
jgi:hypothetical protein